MKQINIISLLPIFLGHLLHVIWKLLKKRHAPCKKNSHHPSVASLSLSPSTMTPTAADTRAEKK
jgi:hypothetical protein